MSAMLCNVLKSDTETHLTIYFKFIHSSQERLFSFKRNKDELLADLSKRMRINFEKFLKGNKSKLETTFLLEISFQQNKQAVDLNIKNEDFWREGSELHINDHIYDVHTNLPMVVHLKFPNTLLSGYTIYPYAEIINGSISESIFTWFRRKRQKEDKQAPADALEWQQIGTGFVHLLTSEDLGHEFKVSCEPCNGTMVGLSVEATSNKDVLQGPTICPFEARHRFTDSSTASNQFRVVSYNLLADIYADSQYSQDSLYPYCKGRFLSFDYRKLLILKEIIGYNGDLLFLQEVDKIFIQTGIGPILDNIGYDSYFLCKEQMVEGLAIFYRRSKFNCLQNEDHTFSNLLLNSDLFDFLKRKVEQNVQLLNRISKLKNSLQILLLNSVQQEKRLLLVCNLHLYSKDDADHIRLIQSFICFKYVENMIETIKKNKDYLNHTISLVISGDFNSTPEFGVVKLVNNKQVDSKLEDFRINPAELVDDLTLCHNLNLQSACGFPSYTNYTQNFTGCLDYIFYGSDHLKVVNTVPMPDHEDVTKDTALPSETFPSDHIALVCTLECI